MTALGISGASTESVYNSSKIYLVMDPLEAIEEEYFRRFEHDPIRRDPILLGRIRSTLDRQLAWVGNSVVFFLRLPLMFFPGRNRNKQNYLRFAREGRKAMVLREQRTARAAKVSEKRPLSFMAHHLASLL